MTRDPLLPVRLVDGVWTTEGAGSAAVPTEHHPGIMALGRGAEWPCSVTLPPRPVTDYARAFAEYNPPPRSEAEIPVTMDADEAILSAVADLSEYLPGDNAEQRLAALGLACVGVLTLTTAIAVLAVALGVCL